MREAILMMLLAVVSSNAAAEWISAFVTDDEAVRMYADPATIRQAGDTARIWRLSDFKTAREIRAGKSYLSSKEQAEYDCKEERVRVLYFQLHSDNMGMGAVVYSDSDPGKWQPIPPRTANETVWKFACENPKPAAPRSTKAAPGKFGPVTYTDGPTPQPRRRRDSPLVGPITYDKEDAPVPAASPSRTAPAAQPDRTGSGFRVARSAVVTNHHVIDGCNRLRVNGVPAQVRGSDARSDLALLNAALPGPNVTLRAQRAAVGEPVAVAGYPLRGLLSGFNMTTGTLSSLSGIGGDTRYLQITAPVQPGNSGGPMLDSSGNLMGVVVSKLDAIKMASLTGDIPQNVNFALNANVLRSFLDANSVDYDTATSGKTLPPTEIADKAKGFTVLVECWK